MERCGSEYLKDFSKSLGKNATTISFEKIQKAQFYSHECTDITTIEELSIFCRWVESGVPVEHFLGIVPLKKADAATIYSTLHHFLAYKEIQLSKLIGMGFGGAATLNFLGSMMLYKVYFKRILHMLFMCTSIVIYCSVQAVSTQFGYLSGFFHHLV